MNVQLLRSLIFEVQITQGLLAVFCAKLRYSDLKVENIQKCVDDSHLPNSDANNETSGQGALQNIKSVLELSNGNTNNQSKTKSGKANLLVHSKYTYFYASRSPLNHHRPFKRILKALRFFNSGAFFCQKDLHSSWDIRVLD